MKISINWLNEWIDISDLEVGELVERLTMAGLEVEAVEHLGRDTDDVVVGQIEEIGEHPRADRLVVCKVNVGAGASSQIVCGATNMAVGDRVPVALPGSHPSALDFDIVEREVMGVLSQGMLCSEEELDLAKESAGLMILDAALDIGQPVFEALGLQDTILHIGLTPNRSDCLSHLGVARDLAAIYGRKLREERVRLPAPLWTSDSAMPVSELSRLTIEDPEGCPSYSLAVLEDVGVGPSPLWLRRRLLALGMRSVNNIVDVTNFVMMDVGQPLHAFDLDKLASSEIVVRRAREGESLVGIDHREYKLSTEDLVIADAERPVAIAGVMGGADTEVSDQTRRILLECAYFEPRTVRRSARRHGMHTESSHRYERGIDPGAIAANAQRAVALLVRAQEHIDGARPSVARGILHEEVEGVADQKVVTLQRDHANRLLGTNLDDETVIGILNSLGLQVDEGNDPLEVTVPTHRPDLERAVDLVEEIARLYGYDQIEAELPEGPMGYTHHRRTESTQAPTIVDSETRGLLSWMRSSLLDQGLFEVVNYSFVDEDALRALRLPEGDGRYQCPELANPLAKTHAGMRTTLLPGLLDNLRTNLAQRIDDVALFEFGRRYFATGEQRTLGVLLTGRVQPHWSGSRTWDFFDIKGLVEALGLRFELANSSWAPGEQLEPYLHPGVQATWSVDGKEIAVVGQIHPIIAQQQGWEAPVFVAELDIDALLAQTRRRPKLETLSRYPAITRDFALLYDRDAKFGDLRAAIDELAQCDQVFGDLLESVELFDVYEGEQVPAGKRSLAVSIVYRSSERTLTESDVERADNLLIEWLEQAVDARLR